MVGKDNKNKGEDWRNFHVGDFFERVKSLAGPPKGSDYKLKKDPDEEASILQEMSINMDLYNDRLPSNEELIGRSKLCEDKFATDRGAKVEDFKTKSSKTET